MQRRLNAKVLFGTLASLLVLGGAVHLVHSHQVQRNASSLLHQADRATQEKDYARAADLYQRYLQYQPDDTDALVRCAAALEKSSPSYAAQYQTFLLLEQVLRRQPDREDVRRRAVQAAIDLYRFHDAIRHLEYLLSAAPRRADLLHQLGWCQEAVGQYADSAESFRKAIAQAPGRIESYILLAELLVHRLERPAEAPRVMDALVAANPQSWQAHLARARFHYGRGDLDATAADVYKACALAPQESEVLLAAAEVALLKGNLGEARDYVQRGLKLHPKNERLYRSLATLEARCLHLDEAAACLRRGLKELPESVALHTHLAEVLLDQGQAAEVRELLAWLRGHTPPAGLGEYLEGRLLMLDGQWAEAIDKLLIARARLGLASEWTSNVCANLGRCHERLGDGELQLAAYRDAVVLNAGNVPARLELSKALLALRLPEEASLELRHLTSLPEAPAEAWVLYAAALLERYARQAPNATERKELDAVLARAAEVSPAAAELPWLRAERALLDDDKAAALAGLRKAVAQRPGEAKLWAALADMQARTGQPAEALATLEKAAQQLGPRLEIQQALLKYWSARPGAEAHAALQQVDKQAATLPRDERIRLLRGLAEAALLLGEKAAAEESLRQVAALLPKDLRSRLALFDLALSDNRDADTLALLAELRRLEGQDGVLWRGGEAARAIHLARKGDRSRLETARKRLGEIRDRRPDWARASLLQGYLDEIDGKLERAMESYRRAIDLGERPPVIVLRLARWLCEQGRTGEADQVLRQLEDVAPLPREHARLAAEVAVHTLAFKRAVTLARQLVPAKSRDYREQMWLAQIQWLAGQPLEAEETLRLAVAVAPRIPDPWVALVRHLARTQQPLQLDATLEEMRLKVPADRLALTTGRCLEAAGRFDKAESFFLQALAASAGDFAVIRCVAEFYLRTDQPARAEPHLRSLLAPTSEAPVEVAQWARRQLAIALALRKGPGDLAAALKELEKNGDTIEDRRIKAFVLAADPARRPEAVRLFESTLNQKPLTPDEQFLLIQVYDANRDHAKARERMLALLTLHRDQGQYLAYCARILLERGAVDDARFYFTTLERLEPNSPRTQRLRLALRDAQTNG
jgi:predicted Zn-dependent protease